MAKASMGVRLRRSWRRLGERGVVMQAAAVVLVVAIVGGVIALLVGTSGGSGGKSSSSTGASTSTAPKVPAAELNSSRGVSATSISVVFPVIDLAAIGQSTGFNASDENSIDAINTFVKAINDQGGINGRTIDAHIVKFNPLDEADMRSKCKDWTQSQSIFAVVDGLGAWTGDNQLCVTQEGHTPMIGAWSSVTTWTDDGAPFLWWTGADQADVLRNLVHWAKGNGSLRADEPFAIVAGDRHSDDLALNSYLLPALHEAGLEPAAVEKLSASLTDTATVESQAPVVVQRMKAKNVQTVIPLMPFNSFLPYLKAETSQEFFPKILLSDYEGSVSTALGLAEAQYPKALDGQLGTTFESLGNDDHPTKSGVTGYLPAGMKCYDIWKPTHANADDPENQGPIMSWCQAIGLFQEAAQKAGRDLTRKTFVDALASITNFDGVLTPTLTYGPNRHAGPSEFRVVRIHVNDRSHNQCPGLQKDGRPHGSCWQVVDDFSPMVTN
jgi:ABC-type branched-subunit amino acid transport system substrate-binding protein